jgi:putative glycosyltransferase (TIGR04372 family)
LIEHCDVYIGSMTGPMDVALLFEKRIFTVNLASLFHCSWYRQGSLFIPKKAKLNGRSLSLKEQIDLHLFDAMGTGHTEPGVEYVENSAEEIFAALREFLQMPGLTSDQRAFNAYLKRAIIEYSEGGQLWKTPYEDTMQKIRWLARQHTVNGSVAQCWLEKNWE